MRVRNIQRADHLRQAAEILEAENLRLMKEIVALKKEILALKGKTPKQLQLEMERLEDQLASLRGKLFGDSSERGEKADAEKKEKKPQTGHGPKAQPNLPVVEQIHEFAAGESHCKRCGKTLEEWDGQFEESEEIDVVPRRFVVKKHRRKKYRCQCGNIETAPGPVKLIPGGHYSVDFAVEVGVEKYGQHSPLARQAKKMVYEGLELVPQTLYDQIYAVAKYLFPLQDRLHLYVLSAGVIGMDETTWRMLQNFKKTLGKKSNKWQAYAIVREDAVCYRINESRSGVTILEILGDYDGFVMTDGYSAYESARKGGKWTAVFCWSHVRRKFWEARKYPAAQEIVDLIGKLYFMEKDIPRGPPGYELRKKVRDEISREIVGEIKTKLQAMKALPQSALAQAAKYTLKLWAGLTRFLENPNIPLDNNGTERALRGVVVGRKNHYGSKSKNGTLVAALFYSLVESAKLCGVDPKEYIGAALRDAIDGREPPLPHEYAAKVARAELPDP